MAVIDASVQVALMNAADPHFAAATAWHRQAMLAGEQLFAPSILAAEVAAAISRGLDDTMLANRARELILHSSQLHLVSVDAALAGRAASIAADHRIRGCDAVYVALAAELAEALVTFDQQQLTRAAHIVTVHNPVATT